MTMTIDLNEQVYIYIYLKSNSSYIGKLIQLYMILITRTRLDSNNKLVFDTSF